ncbi:hypothetical protein [Bacteroides sp. BFG-606]|uniref:hypothetical protein n=1 Tax=Bacteroides sp. BFG-606 TaxID=2972763 RepID=UPI0021658629|nr:hypothetical protein [Bacteroides sp. BFG-606]MCS2335466.1 hypothetical protein [Bacteroides sp. BFG-606]
MTTVEQKIKSVVDKMEGLTYVFDNWQTANLRLDKLPFPAVVNVLPVSGRFNMGKNQLKDYPNMLIAFLDKTDFDFDGEDNDLIVEKCKNLAREFILRANESRLFEYIEGDIYYSVVYDKLDVNVTGVVIELTPKEINGIGLCYGKDIKEIIYGRKG